MENITEENKNTRIKEDILYFFIYSFIGWILETIYAFYIFRAFVKRGFLFGPICPMYGFRSSTYDKNFRK